MVYWTHVLTLSCVWLVLGRIVGSMAVVKGSGQAEKSRPLKRLLPLCTRDTIFDGYWKWKPTIMSTRNYPNMTTVSGLINNTFAKCPSTLSILQSGELRKQPQEYSCDARYIVPAVWVPKGCQISSYRTSVARLHRHKQLPREVNHVSQPDRPINVLFVGDSVGGQVFAALDCALNTRKLSKLINLTYVLEVFFRRDIPCHLNCTLPGLAGEEFRRVENPTFKGRCGNCKDGIRKSIHDYGTNSVWLNTIPANTDYLVLNMGAWYSYYSHVINSTARYEETLNFVLVPALRLLKKTRPNLQIYWIDLPPFIGTNITARYPPPKFLENATSELEKIFFFRELYKYFRAFEESFEWHLMAEKNELAQVLLSPIGVQFMNTTAALFTRKAMNPMVSTDGLHWW
jgi:hypothetical protein